jgi:anti-anti-sigma factor
MMLYERKLHLSEDLVVPETGRLIVGYRDGAAVVTLVGEHDMSTSDQLTATIREQAERGRGIVVVLSEASFIDSHVVRALYQGDIEMLHHGRRLVVYAVTDSDVDRLLEIAGIHAQLLCADTLDEAVDFAAQRYDEE